jgi:hypothetical protein
MYEGDNPYGDSYGKPIHPELLGACPTAIQAGRVTAYALVHSQKGLAEYSDSSVFRANELMRSKLVCQK